MATIDEVKIVVRAEVDAAIEKLVKLNTTTEKTQSIYAKMRDVMQGPVAAFNTVMRLIGQVKQVSDKMEAAWGAQAEAAALLGNVLKTTGANAWTTQERLEGIASALQKTTKYGDETIESMQTVLLGFRNITGKEFDQATEAVLDMATVMKMDLTSAAQAVGKALDNPAQGLDSLSRQGFKFTEQEKAMMKEMQAAGDLAGAQKIILDELQKTYGGAAKEAGSLAINLKERLRNAIGDVNEEIGRSISNNLKPWRERWIAIATAIGTAAKAQNDFTESMERSQAGVATENDRLLIAENYLQILKDTRENANKGGAAVAEMYGDSSEIEKQIADQEKVIQNIKKEIAIRENNKTAAQKAADAQAEAEKKSAAAVQKYKDSRKLVVSVIDEESEAIAELQKNIKTLESTPWPKGGKLEEDRLAALVELRKQLKAIEQKRDNRSADEDKAYWDALTESAYQYAKSLEGLPEHPGIGSEEGTDVAVKEYWDKLNKGAEEYIDTIEKLAISKKITFEEAMIQYEKEAQEVDKLTKAQEKYRSVIDDISTVWGAASGAINAYMDLQSNQSDAEIAALEASGASEEEIAKKKNEIKKKEFANTKALNIVNTLINTASAVSEALPNIPLSITVGALGLVQSGIIAAQQYVPMANGGAGTVKKATHFIGGEAGEEDYIFAPKRLGGIEKSPAVKEIVEREIKERAMPLPIIAMADGGSGTVSSPTLFLAGEVPGVAEDYSFTPQNKESSRVVHNHFHYHIAGSVIRESEIGMLGANQIARATRGY